MRLGRSEPGLAGRLGSALTCRRRHRLTLKPLWRPPRRSAAGFRPSSVAPSRPSAGALRQRQHPPSSPTQNQIIAEASGPEKEGGGEWWGWWLRSLLLEMARRVISKNSSHLNWRSSCFSSSESSKLGSRPHMKAALGDGNEAESDLADSPRPEGQKSAGESSELFTYTCRTSGRPPPAIRRCPGGSASCRPWSPPATSCSWSRPLSWCRAPGSRRASSCASSCVWPLELHKQAADLREEDHTRGAKNTSHSSPPSLLDPARSVTEANPDFYKSRSQRRSSVRESQSFWVSLRFWVLNWKLFPSELFVDRMKAH